MGEHGLEGVVVAETALSDVDGERGRLILRGHDVEELARRATYEEALALFWGAGAGAGGFGPTRAELARARVAAFERLGSWREALGARDGMDALRGALGQLDGATADLDVVGAVAVVASAWSRLRARHEPIAPRPDAGHAADYLRMATGREPGEAEVRALDRYLVTVIDHGMNASTFASRVVASTGADTVSAVVAAIGALKGPLHGGAPGPVLDMLDAVRSTDGVGSAEGARAWLLSELAAGRRIMGMGHRVYRVRDPRAAVLEDAAKELASAGIGSERIRLAGVVEREAEAVLAERGAAKKAGESATSARKSLHANVELYTAVLLEALGLPRELFSPTFAVSRVAGWCAHVAEQRARGRLIRPASRYVGPMPSEVAGS